jgi:hypothetical protein
LVSFFADRLSNFAIDRWMDGWVDEKMIENEEKNKIIRNKHTRKYKSSFIHESESIILKNIIGNEKRLCFEFQFP